MVVLKILANNIFLEKNRQVNCNSARIGVISKIKYIDWRRRERPGYSPAILYFTITPIGQPGSRQFKHGIYNIYLLYSIDNKLYYIPLPITSLRRLSHISIRVGAPLVKRCTCTLMEFRLLALIMCVRSSSAEYTAVGVY